jgi:FkbM family methyltransferase
MMSPLEYAKWLPNYIKSFGVIGGFALFCRVAALDAGGSSEALPLRVPGIDHPVWLRPGLKDLTILQQIFVKRDYDVSETPQFGRVRAAYQDTLRRGIRPLIIDCGAHVGLSVLWFRQQFPEAHIFAVEPSPDNFAVLRKTLGDLSNLTLFHGGIWGATGKLRITNAEHGMTALRLIDGAQDGEVQAITVEEIMARAGASDVLIVKIDIEGGEAELFRHSADWLDRTRLVAIELHDWLYPWQGTSHGFFRQTSCRAFDYLFRGENLFCFRHDDAAGRAETV